MYHNAGKQANWQFQVYRLQVVICRTVDTDELLLPGACPFQRNFDAAGAAQVLAERALKPCPGGFTWTSDRRLYGASAVKLTAGQIRAILKNLTMPALLLLAEGGRVASSESLRGVLEQCPTISVEFRDGDHHFHMAEPVAPLAARIDHFLQREIA